MSLVVVVFFSGFHDELQFRNDVFFRRSFTSGAPMRTRHRRRRSTGSKADSFVMRSVKGLVDGSPFALQTEPATDFD